MGRLERRHYVDLGYQNTWDVTRGQAGDTGIIVNYSGGNVAGSFAPPAPYSNASRARPWPTTRRRS